MATRPAGDDVRSNEPIVQVVACGYRSIASSKTDLTFPAWLVRLPDDASPRPNRLENCYWWRSKRDFLLLGRAAKRAGCKRSLPKSAMEKLSQRAPWSRPEAETQGTSLIDASSSSRNHYHVSMTKSLSHMDYFLREVENRCLSLNGETSLKVAWRIFCRATDTTGLTADDVESVAAAAAVPSLQESSRLGQYFCTPENARQLVSLIKDWIKRQTLTKDLLFLEPSCGHGDVVKELLKHENIDSTISNSTVVCYDVDSKAIEHCRKWDSAGRAQWRLGDFLSSTPSDSERQSTVVVLGGPPYTSGAGSGAAMRRDLPQSFLSHCANVWNAGLIGFLLPDRYRRASLAVPPDWRCQTHSLDSSTFFLQGRIKVVQPSVLQMFCRQDDSKAGKNPG